MPSLTKSGLGEPFLAGLGIWFAVRALSQLSSYLGVADGVWAEGSPLAYFLPFAVSGVCGFFLIVFRRRLAVELFGAEPEEESPRADNENDLKPFLISVLGIWFVASGLVDAAYTEANTLLYPVPELSESLFSPGPARALITSEAWLSRIPYLAEIVVGVALFLASGSLVDFWVRLRRAGRSR